MHGGIGDYSARLSAAMSGQGWESFVLTSRRASGAGEPVLAWVDEWDMTIFQTVRDALGRTGADIIHIQYQTGAFQMRPSISLLPYHVRRSAHAVPIVTTFHDLRVPYLFPKAGRLRRWANRLLAFGSDVVIFTNERDVRQVSRARRLAGRVRQIPLGSNLPDVPSVDRASVLVDLGIDPDAFVIGYFGFLTPDKGIEDLVDALERLPDPRPHLLIIGGEVGTTDVANIDYQRQVRQRLARSTTNVTVSGFIEARTAAEALAAVDLIVLPFRGGASLRSGTLIAALRSGTPVISTDPTDDGSLRPLTPGETTWPVPSGDHAALARAVDLLRREPSLRSRLSAAACRVASAFDWSVIARRHAQIYESLI
jgi:glycosyltransferase involved in cell wall biosynthesis